MAVGRRRVHAPRCGSQIQKTAAGPGPPERAEALGLQGLLQPGALPALSARRQVPVSGGGEGGADAGVVEGGRGVRVQRGLGQGAAAAPGGGRVAVGRAQRVAARPVQQLEVAEEAGRGEHLSDFGERDKKRLAFRSRLGRM